MVPMTLCHYICRILSIRRKSILHLLYRDSTIWAIPRTYVWHSRDKILVCERQTLLLIVENMADLPVA